jgi:hypothetical protein
MDDRFPRDSGLVIEDFFEDFDALRDYLDRISYEGEVNPADGVFYPGISTQVPEYFQTQIEARLGVKPKYLFLRLSPVGQATPHQAHHDAIMAENTMVIYLNKDEDCQGGTSIVTHKECGDDVPDDIWRRDTNRPEQWEVRRMYDMAPNKCVVYPSETWHRSEPVGGFGDVPKNARLVMVGFFDDIKASDVK